MANPTSAFGWQMPTSTDLVTDLPADFEVFGQAVDTSLADLKGGTSGQILAKASNTDMDFTWVTNDVGDITGVTAGTGLTGGGTSGAVTLNVDPTYAGFTNMLYAKNALYNSGFEIWQRGTSIAIAVSANYIADRWRYYRATTGSTGSRSTDVPTGFTYSAKVQRDSGNTATNDIYIGQALENVDSARFVGQNVTLSYWAKAGANFSAASNQIVAQIQTGSGTNQAIFDFAVLQNLGGTQAITTTWTKYTFSGTVSGSATQIGARFYYTPVGTAGADDAFYVTGVQLEIGSTATLYSRQNGTIQGELAACQRYYLKSYNQATAPATSSNYVGNFGYSAISSTATHNRGNVRFPVVMRTTPTMTIYSPGTGTSAKIFNEQASADVDGASQYIGESGFHVYPTSGTPALGNQLLVHYVASAEL